MIHKTYIEYRRLFSELDQKINSVLEVGALPNGHALLNAPELERLETKVGVNLFISGKYKDIEVIKADARELPFPNLSFDLIVCASTLEHIPNFWVACGEMKRVLNSGGVMIVSVPGFVDSPAGNKFRRISQKMHLPDLFQRGTPTMRIHDAPHDYYRFSISCVKEVVMSGLEVSKTWSIMNPPRIYSIGSKP